jgi:hypothetical protein
MKKNCLSLLLAGLLAGSTGANATLVSWLFSGEITVADGTDLPSDIHVGDTFSAILHFDTSTPPNNFLSNQATCFPNNGGPGSICHHNDAPFSSQYWSDVTVNGIDYGMVPSFDPLDQIFNAITVRNNAPDPENPSDTIDGYAFSTDQCSGQCGVGDEDIGVFVAIRGLDLSLVTDARLLPENPSPSMNTARTREWDVCQGHFSDANLLSDCALIDVEGVFNSVSRVPEPATLALLGIGLAGIGFSGRRKH